MTPFVLLILIGLAYGQHSCVHDNYDHYTADHVLDLVARHADHDRNGEVSIFELISEFVTRFDTYPHDLRVDRQEFIYNWQLTFNDVQHFSAYLFLHLDRNHDKVFGAEDITPLYNNMDANHDGTVTVAEFRKWFEVLYKNCVVVPGHN